MSGPGSQDTAMLRWLADVIDGGRPMAFTLNWVHPDGLPPPPMGHGHLGPLATIMGYHSVLTPDDSRLLAEEAAKRLRRALEFQWLEPLCMVRLKCYSLRQCLVAAACCTRVNPDRWGQLASLLDMRSGRGDGTFEEALAFLGYDPMARAAL